MYALLLIQTNLQANCAHVYQCTCALAHLHAGRSSKGCIHRITGSLNMPLCLTVEFGLMSTTTDKKTAFAYSGVTKQRGTVLEIIAGRIDVGASISFLSQYPGEAEYLMQPLSCLEVLLRTHKDTICELKSQVLIVAGRNISIFASNPPHVEPTKIKSLLIKSTLCIIFCPDRFIQFFCVLAAGRG
jgi:hypothetical protein